MYKYPGLLQVYNVQVSGSPGLLQVYIYNVPVFGLMTIYTYIQADYKKSAINKYSVLLQCNLTYIYKLTATNWDIRTSMYLIYLIWTDAFWFRVLK